MNFTAATRILMFSGMIPFFAGSLAVMFEVESWWIVRDIANSFALYALAIASFMSGTHWGVSQINADRTDLLIHSNLMVLLPWITFLILGNGAIFYLALAYVFLKQTLIDRQLTKLNILSPAYLRDRMITASIVSVLMLAVAGTKTL